MYDFDAKTRKSLAGKTYCPSNGSEMMGFYEGLCNDCIHDREFQETGEGGCELIIAAMMNDPEHSGYPDEWQYNTDGYPTCTAFTAATRHRQEFGDNYDGGHQLRLFPPKLWQ
jgi:hypothetical protein